MIINETKTVKQWFMSVYDDELRMKLLTNMNKDKATQNCRFFSQAIYIGLNLSIGKNQWAHIYKSANEGKIALK